jgi:glycerol-3-phosphate dehydrogenase
VSPEPQDSYDLIVVGAGVNGAGTARDAALRGLRVCLVEADDVGSGTSATSSRLVHGGIRYLEHGEVWLVRESLRERELLLRNAPHLVQPFPLLIPFYEHNKRHPMTLRAGMVAYDLLSADKTTPWHRLVGRRGIRRWPGLAT